MALAQKTAQYIISLDTYPTPHFRWAYLPLPVQLFLHMDYSQVVDPNNPAILQLNKPTLLRYGVEQYANQSFLGTFAYLYAHKKGLAAVPSVVEFKKILASTITLDMFVTAHNGSLLSAFAKKPDPVDTIDMKPYKNTPFMKSVDLRKPEQRTYAEDAVSAFENFIEYLKDTKVNIDHTYMWDFVCTNHTSLIDGGVNLVIMEIKANDMLERIELICPSNLYSSNTFNPAKESMLVLKHDDFYEPIVLYEAVPSGAHNITKLFSSKSLHKNIKTVLLNVELISRKYCPALPSLPKIYTFQSPIPLSKLVDLLHGMEIESQVLNYQGKTIAIMVKTPDSTQSVWVPCAPSAKSKSIAMIKYMDDLDLWRDYETTKTLLSKLATKIPCKPVWKILEQGIVVGFLTETNQFVPIKPNENIVVDEIRQYEGVNHIAADTAFATSKSGDKDRILKTQNIRLESEFYYVFRNKIRTLLSAFVNKSIKHSIREIADNQTLLYNQKITKIEDQIRSLIEGEIVFVDIDPSVLLDLASINDCETKEDESPYCIIKENGESQLTLPKRHLLSGHDNEEIYVGRIADELVRNERIKAMMFDSSTRMNAKTVDYSIHPDEFIMPQSAITTEYFAELDHQQDNPYTKYTNYESADPSISVKYPTDPIPLSEQYSNIETSGMNMDCVSRVIKIVGNKQQLWKRVFPDTANEVVYRDTEECTFKVMETIMMAKLGKTFDQMEVKRYLWIAYSNLCKKTPENLAKICSIMRLQGKSKMFEPAVKKRSTLTLELVESIIMSDRYYISDLDIWALANEYDLPIILFNSNKLKGFVKDIEWLKLGGDIRENYYFIRSNIGSIANKVYEYNLIVPTFKLSELKEFYSLFQESLRDKTMNTRSLEEMLLKTLFVAKQ